LWGVILLFSNTLAVRGSISTTHILILATVFESWLKFSSSH